MADITEADLLKAGFRKIIPGISWDFESQPVIRGIFIGKEEGVGPNNSCVYNLEVEGKPRAVWGSTVLDTRLKNVGLGDEVVIIYKGMVASEKRKGSSYKDYDVYHKPVEVKNE